MRISDWSSDVCSSDLRPCQGPPGQGSRNFGSDQGADPRYGGALRPLLPSASRRSHRRDCDHGERGHRAYHRLRHPGELSRSEEHTSELQSLMRISYAVFCLKKKNTHNTVITHEM